MDCSPPGPLSMGFSRQEYCSGLPYPSPGDLPDPEIEPRSPALQANSLPSEPPGKPDIIGPFKVVHWEFPGSSMVRTLYFHGRGQEFNPWLGN